MMKRKRLLIWAISVPAVVVIITAFIPAILSTDAGCRYVLRRVSESAAPYKIQAESWSFSWFSGIRAEGLSVKGPEVDISVEHAKTSAGIVSASRMNLGEIKVSGMDAAILVPPAVAESEPIHEPSSTDQNRGTASTTRPDAKGSRAAASGPADDSPSIPENLKFSLTLEKSSLEITSGKDVFAFSDINSHVACNGLDKPLKVQISARERGGKGTINVRSDLVLGGGQIDPSKIAIDSDIGISSFNLASVSAVASTFPGAPAFSGTLDVSGHIRFKGTEEVNVKADVRVADLKMHGGLLGSDKPEFELITIGVDAELSGKNLTIRKLEADAPFLILTATGHLDGLDADVPAGSIQCRGHLDIASLAQQFPATMKLNSDLKIQKARLAISANVDSDPKAITMSFNANLPSIDAVREGKAVGLDQPVSMGGRAVLESGKFRIEDLSLVSSFASCKGKGSIDDFNLLMESDLGAASSELSRFVDTGGVSARGGIKVSVRLVSMPDAKRRVMAKLNVADLIVQAHTPAPLKLESLSATVGATIPDGPISPASGLTDIAVTINSTVFSNAASVASISMPEGKSDPDVVDARITGGCDLAGIMSLLRGMGLVTDAPAVSGRMSISSSVSATDGKWQLPLKLDVKGLSVKKDALSVEEPEVTLEFAGAFDGDTMGLTADKVSLSAQLASLQMRGRASDLGGLSLCDLAGSLTVDFSRLSALIRMFSGLELTMTGRKTGNFSFRVPLGQSGAVLSSMLADAAMKVPEVVFMGVSASFVDMTVAASNGVTRAQLKVPVNGGTVDIRPVISSKGGVQILTVADNSRIMDKVELTDAMVAEMLAKIHPILKGCAVVAGDVGLVIDHCTVPLGPEMNQEMTVAGRFEMNDVVLTPDGLLKEVMELLDLEPKPVTVPKDALSFKVQNGRIEPSPLVIKTHDFTLTFGGWIGADGSLHYTAEIPVNEKMVKPEYFKYVKNVKLKLEIGGTVDKPALGKEQFAKALGGLLEDAAIDVGSELLKDASEKLLKGLFEKM